MKSTLEWIEDYSESRLEDCGMNWRLHGGRKLIVLGCFGKLQFLKTFFTFIKYCDHRHQYCFVMCDEGGKAVV